LGWVDVNQPKRLKGTVSVNLSGHDMGASYVSGLGCIFAALIIKK
jgi:hypothetical protein